MHLQFQEATVAKLSRSGPSGFTVLNSKLPPTSTRRSTSIVKPFSTVPLARDPDFVDRPEIRAWLREKLSTPGSRAALVGPGGVGKSFIAFQYAHSAFNEVPPRFVFWVHASSRERFEAAYRDIADRLDVPARHDPKTNILQLVCDSLCNDRLGEWLMILDNVDDPGTFTQIQHEDSSAATDERGSLTKYLPQSRNGSILVTSRNREAAAQLTSSFDDVKNVGEMDVEEGLQLLRNKLHHTPTLESALDLLSTLDYMPLAISHATAYMNQVAQMTPAIYLNEFRTSSKIDFNPIDTRWDENVSNSTANTWQLSFDRIKRERSSAAELLSLMSFFHSQSIPEAVLRQYINKCYVDRNSRDCDASFEDDLHLLREYSLISAVPDTTMYSMHALVQFCTRSWLTLAGHTRRYEMEFVNLMAQAYPDATFETQSECQQLQPHAEQLLEVNPESDVVGPWGRTLSTVASFMHMQGSYKGGQAILRKVLSVQENLLGPTHESLFESLNLLGLLLRTDGNYTEARTHIERARAGRIELFGANHETTLISSSNLAGVFRDLSMLGEAERLYKDVYDCHKTALGAKHLTTFASASNLAIVLRDLGEYEESAFYCRYCLEGSRDMLGEQHPDTLLSLNNLGGALQAMGQLQEAEESYQRALDGRKMVFGEKHPLTLTSQSNVASVLLEQGKYEKAETIGRQVLKHREEVDGKHPHTFTSMSNLSRVLEEQEKYGEAETLSRRALVGRLQTLGELHLDTLISTNNLAILLGKRGQYEEAASHFEKARNGLEAQLGPEHPWTLLCRSSSSDMELGRRKTARNPRSLLTRARTRLRRRTIDLQPAIATPVVARQVFSACTLPSRASSIATSSRRYGTSAA